MYQLYIYIYPIKGTVFFIVYTYLNLCHFFATIHFAYFSIHILFISYKHTCIYVCKYVCIYTYSDGCVEKRVLSLSTHQHNLYRTSLCALSSFLKHEKKFFISFILLFFFFYYYYTYIYCV